MIAAWTALLRLAGRDARRNRGRAALVVALIAVPVAGVVAAATLYSTVVPSPTALAQQALGAADLAAYASDGADAVATTPDDLPAGATVEPLWRGELSVGGRVVAATATNLDGLGAGTVTVEAGRTPQPGADEIVVTRPLAERAGVDVGATIGTDLGARRVVGVARAPLELDRAAAYIAPDDAPARSGLLVALPVGADVAAEARTLERDGWDVTTRADVATTDPEQLLIILVLGGFALLVAGLVAGAAFAVSAQRRRRELALLAAAGAGPRHLRWSILTSALLLGTIGALSGAAIGLAAAAATLPWLEAWTNRAVDGLVVDPVLLTVAAAAGMVTATAGAWLTARSVGRTPVDAALAGRRPPRTSGRRLLLSGTACVAVGTVVIGATAASAAANAAAANEVVTALGLLAGTAAVMVGLGAVSPWLIDRFAGRLSRHLPVGARLALRDIARYRSRTGPIVMAIVAGLGLSIAVGATLRSIEVGMARDYTPLLADDQLLVDGAAPQVAITQLRGEVPIAAAAPVTITRPVDPERPRDLPQVVTVADARLLDAVAAPSSARAALDAGRVLVLTGDGSQRDVVRQADALAPDGIEVVAVDVVPDAVPPIVLSRQTLDRSGARPAREGTRWLLRAERPLTSAQVRQAEVTARRLGQRVTAETGPPALAGGAIRTVALVGAGGLSLLVVGIGLALIAAETRSADETLVAVGAPPRARRGLAAARAAVLTVVGGLLAVPAGLLPVLGIAIVAETGSATRLAIPWDAVAFAVLVVPTVTALAAWVATRPAGTTLAARPA